MAPWTVLGHVVLAPVTNDEKHPRSGTSLPQVDNNFLDSARARRPSSSVTNDEEDPRSGTSLPQVDNGSLDSHG